MMAVPGLRTSRIEYESTVRLPAKFTVLGATQTQNRSGNINGTDASWQWLAHQVTCITPAMRHACKPSCSVVTASGAALEEAHVDLLAMWILQHERQWGSGH